MKIILIFAALYVRKMMPEKTEWIHIQQDSKH